jgi:hypothetical protein
LSDRAASAPSSGEPSRPRPARRPPHPPFAAIEADLGFRPVASIALHVERRRRPPATIRIDLPRAAGPRVRTALAQALAGMVARLRAPTRVDVVVYCAEGEPRASAERYGNLAEAVRSRLHAAGYRVGEVYGVAGGAWAVFDRAHPSEWCLLPPVSADSTPGPPPGARSVTGDVHLGAYVPIVPASAAEVSRSLAAHALETQEPRGTASGGAAAGLGEGGRSAGRPAPDSDPVAVIASWAEALEGDLASVTGSRPIALAWSLRRKAVRDCVLMLCAWDADAAVHALAESLDPDLVLADPRSGVLGTFLGAGLQAPDARRVRRSVELLRHVAASAPASLRAAPLTMLAWFEWARGRGSVASAYLRDALATDPRYELAVLFRTIVERGSVPEWIGDADAA